ncbi:MAG TPA: IPT/TIG domain-containing protein [Pyrinomonadaceae bacterium]|nr:IPT/TIG domain-containing protein [Pyrinomonadaceae bacterium]
MKIVFLEGKTSTERNKIIAAGVLGVVALVALFMAFGPSLGSSSSATSVKVTTATPKPAPPVTAVKPDQVLPTAADQAFVYETTPVVYIPGRSYAPDPGRNIFAFYEPPPPCLDCPTPTPKPTPPPPPPTPAPTPPMMVTYLNPPNLFAGIAGFKLQVGGNNFTPDSRIYFNQNELPTVFVNPQTLSANIPANFVTQEGPRQIIVQTPDGKLYSNQMMLTVLPQPKPTVEYIGMIGRKLYHNDTAYFREKGTPTEYRARLNDVVNGRFRLVDISAAEVIFEDTQLGFRHRVPIAKASPSTGSPQGPRGFPSSDGFVPFNPNPGVMPMQPGGIPGIPANIQPAPQPQQTPQRPTQRQPSEKKDVDDDGNG